MGKIMLLRVGVIFVGLVGLVACGDSPNAPAKDTAAAPETLGVAPPLVPPPEVFATDIPVDLVNLETDPSWTPAKVEVVEGVHTLKTHTGSGGFSAIVNLPPSARVPGAGFVRVELQVKKGALLLTMTALGNSAVSKSSAAVAPEGPSDQVVDLAVADLNEPLSVLFSNGSDKGQSEAVIRSVHVMQRTAPSVEMPAAPASSQAPVQMPMAPPTTPAVASPPKPAGPT